MGTRWSRAAAAYVVVLVTLPTVACSADREPGTAAASGSSVASPSGPTAPPVVEMMVKVAGGRQLYLRCEGTGSPTVVLEGGDEDTSGSYDFAMADLAAETRTCVYDRANLGRSDPDRRRRELVDLVADFEAVLDGGNIPGSYVLVGTSGGGNISIGYAVRHSADVAGMVFVEVPAPSAPFRDPPPEIVEATRWNSPVNVESRDYLQVEKDAWAARRQVGDIPVTLISNQYSAAEIAAAEFAWERQGMRTNVRDQKGWLVLSPRAGQVVVHTGHAVEEADPDLVGDTILEVVADARAAE